MILSREKTAPQIKRGWPNDTLLVALWDGYREIAREKLKVDYAANSELQDLVKSKEKELEELIEKCIDKLTTV